MELSKKVKQMGTSLQVCKRIVLKTLIPLAFQPTCVHRGSSANKILSVDNEAGPLQGATARVKMSKTTASSPRGEK